MAVQLHANASLLPMPQIKRAVQSGQVQMGEMLLGAYGNEDPFFEVDAVPFLAETWPRAVALDHYSHSVIFGKPGSRQREVTHSEYGEEETRTVRPRGLLVRPQREE